MWPSGSSSRNDAPKSSGISGRQPQGRGDSEERERRRREWMKQQQREREHEILKRRKIEEYERKRKAQEEAKNHRGRSSNPSGSRNNGERSNSRTGDENLPSTSRNAPMSQRLESSSNNELLFKGPEGTTIDKEVLRRIKIDIHRNIPAPGGSNSVLQRKIVDPEEIKLKRREGPSSIGRSPRWIGA